MLCVGMKKIPHDVGRFPIHAVRGGAEKRSQRYSTMPPLAPPETEFVRDSEAEYTLEYVAVCPSCEESIKTLKVIRLLRTRVNFTSTLPRHGRVTICPHCRTILSAALTLT